MKAAASAVIIILGALYWAWLLAYGVAQEFPLYFTIALSIILVLLIVSLKLPATYRLNFAVAVVSTGLALLVAEGFLALTDAVGPPATRYSVARSLEQPFDSRTRIQVVKDLRAGGADAFIGGYSSILNQRTLKGDDVIPIAGMSDKLTVYCNETGEYLIYQSDEYGFHNPIGIWGKGNIEIVALGDSFTIGGCVKSEENAVSQIRNIHPNTLNLGVAGIGPWEQYAVFKEYVQELEPRVVLWFYFEGNDILDLERYDTGSLIRRYVDTDFRQRLFNRQGEIDDALTTRYNGLLNQENAAIDSQTTSSWRRSIYKTVSLQRLRVRTRDLIKDCSYRLPDATLTRFGRVLRDSNDSVRSWGGTMYFIYLPAPTRYLEADTCWSKERLSFTNYHGQILSLAESAGLSVIDVAEVFDSSPDPLSLVPFRIFNHYNADGYGLVAAAVLESLQARD